MSADVKPLTEQHLESAAWLVCHRYTRLREAIPALPPAYADTAVLLPLLHDVIQVGTGSAYIEDGRLKGFLTGWRLPSFQGKACAYSPEWANAADLFDSRRIYERLYAHQAAAWVSEGYHSHLVTLFTNDCEGIETWQWAGFGMLAVDAVRDLQPVPEPRTAALIRQARAADVDAVIALQHAMTRHGAGSPIFLFRSELHDRAYYESLLHNPAFAVWIAEQDGRVAGFLQIGPANEEACTIIRDEKTASITGAFTQEQSRGQGVATSLLNQSLAWARANGFERCSVDFESMNFLARRFWLRYFQPVCYSLFRQVDERLPTA